jgi:hypothetical protein
VSGTLPSSVNNLGSGGTLPGYVAGVTNLLTLTPAGGGSTITGLVAGNIPVTIYNASQTDPLIFLNLSGLSSSTNQFQCSGGASAGPQVIQPTSAAIVQQCVAGKWNFLS